MLRNVSKIYLMVFVILYPVYLNSIWTLPTWHKQRLEIKILKKVRLFLATELFLIILPREKVSIYLNIIIFMRLQGLIGVSFAPYSFSPLMIRLKITSLVLQLYTWDSEPLSLIDYFRNLCLGCSIEF